MVIQETVITPAQAKTLQTLEVDDDADAAAAAHSLVLTYCNVNGFLQETIRAEFNTIEIGRFDPITSLRPHITNIASVTDSDGSAVAVTLAGGLLYPDDGWPTCKRISIVYTAGWTQDTLPRGIVVAAKLLTKHIQNQFNDETEKDVQSEHFLSGLYARTYAFNNPKIRIEVKHLLAPWRRITL